MRLPVLPPVEPMLATAVTEIPVAEAMTYEPKWDGYRTIVFRDGDQIQLASRGGKSLTRYFPELVTELCRQLPDRCVVDGEIVVIRRDAHPPKLDFDLLGQRIHPATSRITQLSAQTPASFIAFDLLALADQSFMAQGYATRRAALVSALADLAPPIYLTPATTDLATAQRWYAMFEGAGLDGVVAKPATIRYVPGKRLMFKIKHARTADVVVAGFREHTSGPVLGSLLLGLYDDAGTLHHVGVCANFSAERRARMVDELAPYREGAERAHPWLPQHPSPGQRVPGTPSRWSGGKDLGWLPLRPELVAEVGYDAMEGDRFRHTAQFKRWRPDRIAESCGYAQLERPIRFDVDRILTG